MKLAGVKVKGEFFQQVGCNARISVKVREMFFFKEHICNVMKNRRSSVNGIFVLFVETKENAQYRNCKVIIFLVVAYEMQ